MATKRTSKPKVKKAETITAPKKIRMLTSLANPQTAYVSGKVYEVGKDVSAETAMAWVASGAAMEDKVLEVETKKVETIE